MEGNWLYYMYEGTKVHNPRRYNTYDFMCQCIIHANLHVYTCTYKLMYTHVHVHVHVYTCMNMHVHVHAQTCTNLCIHVYIQCTCVYINLYMYMIHTCMYRTSSNSTRTSNSIRMIAKNSIRPRIIATPAHS